MIVARKQKVYEHVLSTGGDTKHYSNKEFPNLSSQG